MAVNIDRRELCFRHRMLRGHQRRSRPVIENTGRRCRGRLAQVGTNFGHPWRTFLAGFDWRAAAAPALGHDEGAQGYGGQKYESERSGAHSLQSSAAVAVTTNANHA